MPHIFRSAALVLALGLAAMPAGPSRAATKDAPKPVETERIVVDPAKPAAQEVRKGDEDLPPLVAKTRAAILEAAYSGDMDRLRAVMQRNETPPSLSVNEIGDPIEYLKGQSGDGQGLEILAILTDVLESSWAKVKPGTPQEMYVWPSFAARAIDALEPGELVELYKIVTSSDYEEMKTAGKYIFYTVGIGPDGTWHYFKLND